VSSRRIPPSPAARRLVLTADDATPRLHRQIKWRSTAHGELEPTDAEWLGSVRWARLLGRLYELDIEDPDVKQQWRCLLDVLDDQGDLGMTNIDPGAVRGWARYQEGREALI